MWTIACATCKKRFEDTQVVIRSRKSILSTYICVTQHLRYHNSGNTWYLSRQVSFGFYLFILYSLAKWIFKIGDDAISVVKHIGGVMVNVLALSAVDRGFKPRSGLTKDQRLYNCFCAKEKEQRLVGPESE